jgi:diaminopimelate epimerase
MPLSLPFAKFQGAGNDFAIVDGRPGRPAAGLDWAALAITMCDRHYGVGADGILVAVIPDGAQSGAASAAPTTPPRVGMRMFNPDGSESEMCGNGLRCFTRWLADAGEITSGAASGDAAIQTGAGVLHVTLLPDRTVSASMGAPILAPERIPVALNGQLDLATPHNGSAYGHSRAGAALAPPLRDLPVTLADGTTLAATCISMGNPHAVFFVDDVASVPLDVLGPQIERHPLFPRRTNVEFVQVLAPDRLRVRVWERGAGITLACGTGACASMVAARLHGLIASRATLELPGGNLDVRWDGAADSVGTDGVHSANMSTDGPLSEVILSGPATRVFDGVWLLDAPTVDNAAPSFSNRTERAADSVAAQKADSQW